jgi:hypothetical protein
MTERIPRSSISRMVKTLTPACWITTFSALSIERGPTITAFEGSTFGLKPPIPVRSGSPSPSAIASAMPWMLPDGVVSGVFMSPWASNQMRPMDCCFFLRWGRGRGRADRHRVIAARTTGTHRPRAPTPRRSPARGRSRGSGLVLELRVAVLLLLGVLDRTSPKSSTT